MALLSKFRFVLKGGFWILFLGLFIFPLFLASLISRNVFILSADEISRLVPAAENNCRTLMECPLRPGDILIRRQPSQRTWLMAVFLKSYFTHSAIYYGNDVIIEAGGNESNEEEEIKSLKLSSSDWVHEKSEKLIVVRPLAESKKLVSLLKGIKAVAEDPEYRFGFSLEPSKVEKVAACADLIFDAFRKEKIIEEVDVPSIITPDYLFWYAATHPELFRIVSAQE